jgi:hypothetical protein
MRRLVRLGGRHIVAADGRLLVVEAATTLDAIPIAAKAAIQKKVGGGRVTTVETFAKPGKSLLYEGRLSGREGQAARSARRRRRQGSQRLTSMRGVPRLVATLGIVLAGVPTSRSRAPKMNQ